MECSSPTPELHTCTSRRFVVLQALFYTTLHHNVCMAIHHSLKVEIRLYSVAKYAKYCYLCKVVVVGCLLLLSSFFFFFFLTLLLMFFSLVSMVRNHAYLSYAHLPYMISAYYDAELRTTVR